MTADHDDAVRTYVADWLRRQGARPMNDVDESLLRLGIDSMAFLDLVAALEERFAVTIDFTTADPEVFTTLRGLATLVGSAPPSGV
jgi:acyl carrier protein